MSMLQHFFAPEVRRQSTKGLFDNLDIAKFDGGKYIEQYQGKYPTVFLSFKDVEGENFETCLRRFYGSIIDVYDEFDYLLESDKLSRLQIRRLSLIYNGKAKQPQLESSLHLLCECLHEHHDNSQVCVLIDEYDAPLNRAYLTGDKQYYDSVVRLVRRIFSTTLKGNPYLWKGVLTGILRVAKEDIFSGLNNIEVCTVLDKLYSKCFGFNHLEVKELFEKQGFNYDNEVDKWYNGYKIGDETMFNPFCIILCIREGCKLSVYWVGSAGDDRLVKNLIINSDLDTKSEILKLMRKKRFNVPVDKLVAYSELLENQASLWTILLFSGYLTYEKCRLIKDTTIFECTIKIPNYEIFCLYNSYFVELAELAFRGDKKKFEDFLTSIPSGNMGKFIDYLNDYLLHGSSYFDLNSTTTEKYYHVLVFAILNCFSPYFYIRSNREAGKGRYDLILIPKERGLKAVLFEIKVVTSEEQMEDGARIGLDQIRDREYRAELSTYPHVSHVIECGLCFCKKEALVAYCIYSLQSKTAKRRRLN